MAVTVGSALAVDLRFFHAHLSRYYKQELGHEPGADLQGPQQGTPAVEAGSSGSPGSPGSPEERVPLYRLPGEPVLSYRHRPGASMCAATPRRVLLRLRLRALEVGRRRLPSV